MRYSNKFLKMYLTDICSLHLAERELSQRIRKLQTKIEKAQTDEYYRAPASPNYETPCGCLSVAGLCLGAFMAGGVLIGFMTGNLPSDFAFIGVGGLVIGVAIIWAIVRAILETKQSNDVKRQEYEEACANHIRATRELNAAKEKEREMLPKYLEKVAFYKQEIAKIVRLRERAYALDIIGLRYRDIYTAMYLYDYFYYSREEDLSLAINTYVLEQIKEKLIEMIELQGEIILNQRIQIANQEMAIDEQRRHSKEMKQQIRQLTSKADEQNQYLDMIHTNTTVSAFFSAATYFKSK